MAEPLSDQPVTIAPSSFTALEQTKTESPRPRKPRRSLLYLCIAFFVVVMVFLLTARSLQITVAAETPFQISISGLAIPFGQRYLMPQGEYTINVRASGYHPLIQNVTVDSSENQRVELLLEPLPGFVSFDSEPTGASVSIDGEEIGPTPLSDLRINKGEHQLLIEDPRHLSLQQTLLVTGREIRQQLHFQLEPAWAEVTVDSAPSGATILVNGEPAGQTPATVEILQGEHQLILQLPAYADWQQTLNIEAGNALDLGQLKLQPASGLLELSSVPSGANITLDGEFQGQTPMTLAVSPDRAHRLAIFKPGYARYNGTVELPAAGSDQRTVKLTAQLGEVTFRISPANATLRINGKTYGKGNQTLSLPAVEHRIDVSLKGYASVRRSVTPRPGLAQQVSVALKTQEETKMARLTPEVTTPLGQTLLLFKPGESSLADFTMGASRREPGRRANEVLHPVSLRRLFYLQTTEVTNAQFRQFQRDHNSGQIEGKSLNQENQPAVNVSWQQAAAFCNWLSKKEGMPLFYRENKGIVTGYNAAATGYRLPSEAEWAWAARASGKKLLKFPWGDTFPPNQVAENYADSASAYVTGRVLNNYTDGHVVSAPVASLKPNQHGLYDMGGNVAEWVNDVYGIPSAAGASQKDPLGSQNGDNYVIRGASWAHAKLAELRLSRRDYGQAGRDDVGFRLARYAE